MQGSFLGLYMTAFHLFYISSSHLRPRPAQHAAQEASAPSQKSLHRTRATRPWYVSLHHHHSTLISWHRQRAPPPFPHPHTSRLHRRLPLLCHLFRTYSGPYIPRPRRRISPAAGAECRPGQDEHQRRASTSYPVSLSFVCSDCLFAARSDAPASRQPRTMVVNIV